MSYGDGGLAEHTLAPAPLAQFRAWYTDVLTAGVAEPNAMTLATVGATGAPGARVVLLKQADTRGFTFFTNHTSRKGAEIDANPHVALVFAWLARQRQVNVRGVAERVSREETAAYFASRPWGSRIGAHASHQSRPTSREDLDARYAALAARWPDHGRPDDVPVPDHWGGYVVRAGEVEFWQGRPSRLHDRLVYLPKAERTHPPLDDATAWTVERRSP